jgi:hypothetical protein
LWSPTHRGLLRVARRAFARMIEVSPKRNEALR